ncbi:AAA family ATPase [Chryseobacterium oryzae]|uniref:AAA family ATPase n=1 Tax=Chryseobacterium oryzae TaxID=2929799 RepID=A0ABY4BPI4_9FLAO|nr:AAA family ATPase [Chryseobacterium oryzae]UOE39628.1 AAA family ATPase [Chryseobacterium oryzae]
MSEVTEIAEVEQQLETLETEVKKFANELPYWAKFLAEKILLGNAISDNDIDTSHSYLLEHLQLIEETPKPEIEIDYNAENSGNYKTDLLFTKLENVEGVNALTENQTIEFSPNLTIIYGTNGSGKSGYVRLLKNVFYSKAPENILPNVHIDNGHKNVNAKFTFKSNNAETSLEFANKDNAEFEQFAVFDGNSVLKHLENKNEFEFRPAGLSFFADYTNSVIRVEQKLNAEITIKQSPNDFSVWFDGNSEIKTLVESLNAETKIDDLKKYTPFSDEDKTQKETIQKQYDELLLASKGKEKEIKTLEGIKSLLAQNKQAIEKLNQFFTTETIGKVKTAITDCVTKETTAKSEEIENFKTDKIENIGTTEWKSFIVSAETFAKTQKAENIVYPENGDNCLLCQQPLSDEAQKLISNYWTFIKSVAEQNSKQAQEKLNKAKENYENLNFDLFPQDNTLTVWLTEKYPNELEALKLKLAEQKTLAENIVSDIQSKTANERAEIKISVEQHTTIETAIEASIKLLKEDEQSKELEKLLTAKTLLEHKEKFNTHFSKFETFVNNQIWIKKANKADYAKQTITKTEKALSNKYFNQKYIDAFNEECQKLNGNFGIDINHTGSAGKSYRQLKLKGKNPNAVLSEGEQKVIAIADFLAEMHLSEINRGIIFDDPVTSLDHSRKETIAQRLVEESDIKQVIIFSHDIVFIKYLENHGKNKYKTDKTKVAVHSIVSSGREIIGIIELQNTPLKDSTYTNSHIPKQYHIRAKKEPDRSFAQNLIRSGYGALRSCYEGIVVTKLLASTVQRYDTLVRVPNIRNVKFNNDLYERIAKNHSVLHDLIEGHLPVDELNQFLTCDKLDNEITEFENILDEIDKI